MRIMGVYSRGHDVGACLIRGGEVVALIEEERLTRVKHGVPKSCLQLWRQFNNRFGYFPWASLNYCLRLGDCGLDDLDGIVLDPPFDDILPIKDTHKIIVMDEPRNATHHYNHALSTFFASPFDRAAVLVVDGDGSENRIGYEAESGYLFQNRSGRYETVFKNRYSMHSRYRGGLGWMYDYVSMMLGFVSRNGYLTDAGKTMGLAAYGDNSSAYSQLRWVRPEGFHLDFGPFQDWLKSSGMEHLCRFEKDRALIQAEDDIPKHALDLAFKAQAELENALLHLVTELHSETGEANLCLAGGTFLNSVANGLISKRGPFAQVFVQPAAGDGGQALGMAYHGHLKLSSRVPISPIRHAFGGKTYSDDHVRELVAQSGLTFREFKNAQALADDAASELLQSRILGWFQGRSEFGPRALGHRSILADPRSPDMKDFLNERVKFREAFRPYAPSVLRERANDVFDLSTESPYMLFVAPVRSSWRDRVPAITHVDGTARIQTVRADIDSLYYAVISAFEAGSGVPLVLNTSFNLRGMPIVESPEDALQCFLFTEMDWLYLGMFKVSRPKLSEMTLRVDPAWNLVVRLGAKSTDVYFKGPDSHGQQHRVSLAASDEIVEICQAFNGRRTLEEILIEVFGKPVPRGNRLAKCIRFVQALLRLGVLRLRVGMLDISPAIMASDPTQLRKCQLPRRSTSVRSKPERNQKRE